MPTLQGWQSMSCCSALIRCSIGFSVIIPRNTSYRHTGHTKYAGHSLLWLQGCLDLRSTPSGHTGKINLGHHRQVRRGIGQSKGKLEKEGLGLPTHRPDNRGESREFWEQSEDTEAHRGSSKEFWEQSEGITLKGCLTL